MNKAISRYPFIDYLRGFLVLWMMIFHFCFILADYKLADFDFYRDPFWLHSRTIIVTGFLTIVGISLVLAHRTDFKRIGFQRKSYNRHLGLLVSYALLVSVSTYIQLGERWIYFGILHFIALATVLALPLIKQQWISLLIGLGMIILGNAYETLLFESKWLNWIGFLPYKPATNDYVPLFPWFGVVLLGIFIGHQLTALRGKKSKSSLLVWQSSNPVFKVLNFLGRQAIHVYIIHAPVFVVLIELFIWLR